MSARNLLVYYFMGSACMVDCPDRGRRDFRREGEVGNLIVMSILLFLIGNG